MMARAHLCIHMACISSDSAVHSALLTPYSNGRLPSVVASQWRVNACQNSRQGSRDGSPWDSIEVKPCAALSPVQQGDRPPWIHNGTGAPLGGIQSGCACRREIIQESMMEAVMEYKMGSRASHPLS
jgi:hypothetical protein